MNVKPKLYILIGLPASGKSTTAERLRVEEDAIVHSSDALREELFGDRDIQDKNQELFKELHRRIKKDLIEGKNVVYDATNISNKRRISLGNEFKSVNYEKIAIFVATPYKVCVERNSKRANPVPEHVLRRMYLNFDVPLLCENWDKVIIEKNSNEISLSLDELEEMNYLNHDNPHHSLTVGEHMKKATDWMHERIVFELYEYGVHERYKNLLIAISLHDIGKKFTKSFVNSKGEITDIAHYYNHENVSAYEAILYLLEYAPWSIEENMDDVLYIAQLIRFHMRPYYATSEKAVKRFVNLVGQEFYDALLTLNTADRQAH